MKRYTKIGEMNKGEELVAAVKVGGYWHWNFKFPFLHFRKEEIYCMTKGAIYKLVEPILR